MEQRGLGEQRGSGEMRGNMDPLGCEDPDMQMPLIELEGDVRLNVTMNTRSYV